MHGNTTSSHYTIASLRDRPDLIQRDDGLMKVWPTFMLYDPTPPETYPTMYEHYEDFQLYWLDENDQTVAACNSMPLVWDGTVTGLPDGWSAALYRGVENQRAGTAPTTLCAIQATVGPEFTGRGLGALVVQGMCQRARAHGFNALIVPVRPVWKARYPLIPIDQYITWTRDDGLLYDPWLRVHQRLGAEILKVAHESMRIPGTIAQWSEWTDMIFPVSGKYVVPGALVPVTVDCEADQVVYVEPNVWMVHWLN
ncbi:MAG: GNAT family N-acetyltransferase [Anaerolineae bacterium]|nr:GNAT family N-acetyltransferase [Anaerolineae bacterium]